MFQRTSEQEQINSGNQTKAKSERQTGSTKHSNRKYSNGNHGIENLQSKMN